MRFSTLSRLVIASLATLGYADDCADGPNTPFAPSSMAGPGFVGDEYQIKCDAKWKNQETIIGVEAWSADWQVKAIKFFYSDGSQSDVRGTVPTQWRMHSIFKWKVGDKVSVQLWNNRPDDKKPMDAVGRIRIFKDDQLGLDVGAKSGAVAKEQIQVNSGTGFMLAAKTKSGAWLQTLEFKMLKANIIGTEIIAVDVKDKPEKWNAQRMGLKYLTFSSVYYPNRNPLGGSPLTYSFTMRDSVDYTSSVVSQSTGAGDFHPKISGNWKIPWFEPYIGDSAKGTWDLGGGYTWSTMTGTETSQKYTKELTYTVGSGFRDGLIPPQKAALCTAQGVSGNFKSDYTGTIRAKFADGSFYDYNDLGYVATVGWGRAIVGCEIVDLKNVPKGATEGETKPFTGKRSLPFVA